MILRGEVYDVELGVPTGHEPATRRPGIVVSSNRVNNGVGGLVGIVPITSTRYGLRSHIELEVGTSGLGHESFARCDQIRMLSTLRLRSPRGHVVLAEMGEIDQALRFLLDL